jgi:hypothetical protein
MSEIKHCAIIIADSCNYDWVIANLLNGNLLKDYYQFSNTEGALYSHISVNKMIEDVKDLSLSELLELKKNRNETEKENIE